MMCRRLELYIPKTVSSSSDGTRARAGYYGMAACSYRRGTLPYAYPIYLRAHTTPDDCAQSFMLTTELLLATLLALPNTSEHCCMAL